MISSTVSLIVALVEEFPTLRPILEEHLEDNEGEVLPNLVLADVIRWLASHVDSDPQVCGEIVDWLEVAYNEGGREVQGMLTVSGVEMIPDPGQPGSALRALLGSSLRRIDPWRGRN